MTSSISQILRASTLPNSGTSVGTQLTRRFCSIIPRCVNPPMFLSRSAVILRTPVSKLQVRFAGKATFKPDCLSLYLLQTILPNFSLPSSIFNELAFRSTTTSSISLHSTRHSFLRSGMITCERQSLARDRTQEGLRISWPPFTTSNSAACLRIRSLMQEQGVSSNIRLDRLCSRPYNRYLLRCPPKEISLCANGDSSFYGCGFYFGSFDRCCYLPTSSGVQDFPSLTASTRIISGHRYVQHGCCTCCYAVQNKSGFASLLISSGCKANLENRALRMRPSTPNGSTVPLRNSAQASTQDRIKWEPKVLSIWTIIGLVFVLTALLVTIAVLDYFSLRDGLYQSVFVYQVELNIDDYSLGYIAPYSIVPTLLAVIVGLWWGALESIFRTAQPFISMAKGPTTGGKGSGISYQPSYLAWAGIRAINRQHWVIAFVCTGAFLLEYQYSVFA